MDQHATGTEPKQLRTPNRSVPSPASTHGKLTLLERSFFRLDWGQLAQWRQAAAIAQAMRNPRHPRYTHSLMDALLAPRRFYGVLSEHTHQEWSGACQELWELGANGHRERYDGWLAGAMHLDFADTLLDAGANPHHGASSNNQGMPALFSALANYQSAVAFPSPFHATDFRQEGGRLLKARIDRCLRYPIADANQRDHYLDLLARHAASAPPEEAEFWRRWRDQLMAQGATPTPRTLSELISRTPIVRAHHVRNEEQQILRWQAAVHEWLDASLPHMPKDWELPNHVWSELMVRPGGEAIAVRCLQAGVRPCWQPLAGQYGSSAVPFIGYHTRLPEALEVFTRLHLLAPATPQWLAQATSNYLSKDHAASPHASMVSTKEISMLLALHDWSPGHALPDPIRSWFTRLPHNWQSNQIEEEGKKQLLGVLRQLGVLSTVLEYSEAGLCRPVSYEGRWLYSRWSQYPQDVAILVEHLPPSAHGGLMVNMAIGGLELENGAPALSWIRQAMALDPGACGKILDAFLPSTREEFSKMGAPKVKLLLHVQSLLLTCGHPAPIGEQALDWMRKVVSLIGPDTPSHEQVRWVQEMVRAGLDLNTCNAALLAEIIAAEARMFPNQPSGANYLEPLVSALLQEGVDPSLVRGDVVPTHALASQVVVARMERLTAVAPKASQRASRL